MLKKVIQTRKKTTIKSGLKNAVGLIFFSLIINVFGIVHGQLADTNCGFAEDRTPCILNGESGECRGNECTVVSMSLRNGGGGVTPQPTTPTIPDCGGGSPLDSSAQGGNCKTFTTTKWDTKQDCGFQYCGPNECSYQYQLWGESYYKAHLSLDSAGYKDYKTKYLDCIKQASDDKTNKENNPCELKGSYTDCTQCQNYISNPTKDFVFSDGATRKPVQTDYTKCLEIHKANCIKTNGTYDEKTNICTPDASSSEFKCDTAKGYILKDNKCCRCDNCSPGDAWNGNSGLCTSSDGKTTYKPSEKPENCKTDVVCIDPSCIAGTFSNGNCMVNNYGNQGIQADNECLLNGQCKLNIYKTLGIRKGNEDMEPKTFIQDIINGAAMFIGTVVTVMILYCGVMMVVSSYSGANPDKYKKGVVSGLIGLVIVTSSYVIVRLVQFLAKGG